MCEVNLHIHTQQVCWFRKYCYGLAGASTDDPVMLEWGSHVRAPRIHPVWCVYDWPALQVEAVASYTFIWTAHHMTCVCYARKKKQQCAEADRQESEQNGPACVSHTHSHPHTHWHAQRLGKFVWECSQILSIRLQRWTLIHQVTQRVCGGVDLEVESGNMQKKKFYSEVALSY